MDSWGSFYPSIQQLPFPFSSSSSAAAAAAAIAAVAPLPASYSNGFPPKTGRSKQKGWLQPRHKRNVEGSKSKKAGKNDDRGWNFWAEFTDFSHGNLFGNCLFCIAFRWIFFTLFIIIFPLFFGVFFSGSLLLFDRFFFFLNPLLRLHEKCFIGVFWLTGRVSCNRFTSSGGERGTGYCNFIELRFSWM